MDPQTARHREGKCPFTGLERDCSPECHLWRRVVRHYGDGREEIIEDCIFCLDHTEKRNQTQRLAMMQSEMGEVKQANLFASLVMCGSKAGRIELAKLLQKYIPQYAGDVVIDMKKVTEEENADNLPTVSDL